MDDESKRLIEIFFSIIFSGAIAYIMTFISEPRIIEDNIMWFVASLIILVFSICMIIFIFEADYQKDYLLIARIFFICVSILIIFSVTRFLHYCNEVNRVDLIDLLGGSYNNILVLLILLNFTLLLNGCWDKSHRKVIIGVAIIIGCLIGFLFIIKDAILYGVI